MSIYISRESTEHWTLLSTTLFSFPSQR